MSRTKQLLSKGCKIPQSILKLWDYPSELSEQPGGAQTAGTRFCTQKSLIQEQIILKTSDTRQEDAVTCWKIKLLFCVESWERSRNNSTFHCCSGASEQPLHRCLIPHQDFWDIPALLIPRILSSEEETIPESVGAAREALAEVPEPSARCPVALEQLPGIPNVFIVHYCE